MIACGGRGADGWFKHNTQKEMHQKRAEWGDKQIKELIKKKAKRKK